MGTGAESTPDKLLDAATRAFAEQGIENASLAEIVRGPGSATRRRSTTTSAAATRSCAPSSSVTSRRCAPAGSSCSSTRGHSPTTTSAPSPRRWCGRSSSSRAGVGASAAYLQIGAELIGSIDRATPEVRRLLRETAGGETLILLAERCPADAGRGLQRARGDPHRVPGSGRGRPGEAARSALRAAGSSSTTTSSSTTSSTCSSVRSPRP